MLHIAMQRARVLLIPKSLNLKRIIILERIMPAKKRPLNHLATQKRKTTIRLQRESTENLETIATGVGEIMEQEFTRMKAQKLMKEMESIDITTQECLMI